MKSCFKLLAIVAAISLPSILIAQQPSSRLVPFSPDAQPFTTIPKPELKLLPKSSTHEGINSPFVNQLPSIIAGKTRKMAIDNPQADPAYYYNMPVVKPGKTSKILIAKLDPNSPYTYNMPIKKSSVVEK